MNNKTVKKGLLPYIFIFCFMIICLLMFNKFNTTVNELTYDEFIKELESNEITELNIIPKISSDTYEVTGKLKEYDETIEDNENIELFVGLGTLFEYKDKYLSLNNLTLLDPNNRKKLIMDINFIRANALCVPVEYLEALKFMIVDSCDDLTDGKKFFLNLLDITIDDKNQFDEEDIPFKRKF